MRPSTPSLTNACGVLAMGKSRAVDLLTPLSVACADSTTATSSSNGVRYSSSLRGFGFAARSRSKISRRLAAFIARILMPASLGAVIDRSRAKTTLGTLRRSTAGTADRRRGRLLLPGKRQVHERVHGGRRGADPHAAARARRESRSRALLASASRNDRERRAR